MSNEALTTVYIVRHGQSEGNILGAQQGHTDYPLTDKGLDQADELARVLQTIQFDSIHSSDLRRAHDTAKAIAKLQHVPVVTTPALRERSFGSLEGQIKKDMSVKDKALYAHWDSLPDDQWRDHRLVPSAETGSEMLARFFGYLNGVAESIKETALVVTHQGMMRHVLVDLGFGTKDELLGNTIANTGYIKMLVDRRKADKERYAIVDTSGIKKRDV